MFVYTTQYHHLENKAFSIKKEGLTNYMNKTASKFSLVYELLQRVFFFNEKKNYALLYVCNLTSRIFIITSWKL